jgi:hypothetical protein
MLQEVYVGLDDDDDVGLVFFRIRGPHRSAVLAAEVRQQQLGLSKKQRTALSAGMFSWFMIVP